MRNFTKALNFFFSYLLFLFIRYWPFLAVSVSISSLYIDEETETSFKNINCWCYPFEGKM